jgi:hypothetical protein
VQLIRLTFSCGDDANARWSELIKDVLWAHAGDSVEHITALSAPVSVNVALFLSHDIADSEQLAAALVEAARAASPVLREWDVKVTGRIEA